MAAVLSSQQYHRRIEETRNSVQTFLRRGDPKEKGCVGPEGGDGRQVVGGRITVSMAAAKKACAKHIPSPAGVPGRSFMRTPRGCETCACGATAGGGGGASTGYNAGRLAPHRLRFCSARSALQQRPADRGAPVPETLPGQQPRLARQRGVVKHSLAATCADTSSARHAFRRRERSAAAGPPPPPPAPPPPARGGGGGGPQG